MFQRMNPTVPIALRRLTMEPPRALNNLRGLLAPPLGFISIQRLPKFRGSSSNPSRVHELGQCSGIGGNLSIQFNARLRPKQLHG